MAALEKALTNNTEAHRCQELAKRPAALAELVTATEQRRQESENCAAVLAEMTLANECRCREAAGRGVILGVTALAKAQQCSLTAAQAAVLADLALPKPAFPKEQTPHVVVECAAMTMATAMKTGADLAMEKMLAELVASRAAIFGGVCVAAAKAMALAESALVEKTCHSTAARAEVLARRYLTDKRCCRELVQRTAAFAVKASTHNKEAAGHARNSPTANMAATVFVADTHRPETPSAAPHRAVAERDTVLMLLLLNNKALAQAIPPSATPMALSSSPPYPMTYVGAVLSTMGGSSRTTSLTIAPSP
jgi:hypothetical protein